MDAILGEVRLFAGDYAPEGWRICDGAVLNVADHEPLFSLIGKTYGGDGLTTFALPDLRGRVPIGAGDAASRRAVGAKSGSALNVGASAAAHKRMSRMALSYIIAIIGSYPEII